MQEQEEQESRILGIRISGGLLLQNSFVEVLVVKEDWYIWKYLGRQSSSYMTFALLHSNISFRRFNCYKISFPRCLLLTHHFQSVFFTFNFPAFGFKQNCNFGIWNAIKFLRSQILHFTSSVWSLGFQEMSLNILKRRIALFKLNIN